MLSYCIQTASASRFGGNQFGGRQSRNPEHIQPDTTAEPAYDDPLVHATAPPPPGAKEITKVGWCEVQVFGHTFSDRGLYDACLPMHSMHIAERLEQLSRKLNFEPEKSGLQLMDDVDALVAYVSARMKVEPAGLKVNN